MSADVPGSAAGDTAPSRRLLLIARDFPPAATSAALRAASFARHLPEHGWTTSVVTIRRGFHAFTDTQLEQALPPHCRILRAFGFDTKRVFSLFGRYPGALAFPDREASWIADGVRQALRACREAHISAVLSTSPAASAHVIAFVVKRATGLPWIAELRDPWNLDTPLGPFLGRLDRGLERRLLGVADLVAVVTAGVAADLARRHGAEIGDKVRLLPNGYDEDATAAPFASASPASRFTVVHTGGCQPTYRDPVPLLRAVRVCLDRGELPAEISVDLVGTPDDPSLRIEVERLQLGAQVNVRERVNHRQSLAATATASLLLLLQTRPEHDLCIPAKAYEYLRTDLPILAVVRDSSETARLLHDFGGVTVVSPTDVEGIARALGAAYRAWTAGAARGFSRDIARYSRRRVAADLARLLDEQCAVTAGGIP